MPTDKQTKQKQNNQFLLNSVRKLDKINNVEVEVEGNIQEVINNPIEWAEKQVEKFIIENQDKYFEAKKLGEGFWNDIRSKR
jgi:hypothetical protein